MILLIIDIFCCQCMNKDYPSHLWSCFSIKLHYQIRDREVWKALLLNNGEKSEFSAQ